MVSRLRPDPCPVAMLIGIRTAVIFAVQSWLAETSEQRQKSSTPGYFSVGMACKSSPLHRPSDFHTLLNLS